MRNFTGALLVAAATITATAKAQTSVEPYYVENGQKMQFEKATAKYEAKAVGMGYGGINSYLTVFGSQSSTVRFRQGSIPKFYLTMPRGTSSGQITIVSADKVKGKNYRRFVQKGMNGFGGGDKDMSRYHTALPLTALGDGTFSIAVPQDLPQGEYSFLIGAGSTAYDPLAAPGSQSVYCFGID